MRNFWQDVRFAARTLRKNMGFTLVAVAALALGIGANTAIFSVVNAVLLRPLPYPEPGRLVSVTGRVGADGTASRVFSYPNYLDLKGQTASFERAAAYARTSQFLAAGDDPERVLGALVSADLFPLLGVEPALGRTFDASEDKPTAERVVVLSHEFWQRRFGSDPNVVGRPLQLGNGTATVVGVMPGGFKFPVEERKAEFWMPFERAFSAAQLANRGAVFFEVVAQLRPDATAERAGAEAEVVARRIAEQYPDSSTGFGATVTPLHESVVGGARAALFVLLGAVGFVLLIACANVANLLLARAAARRKEIAIRTALGASRLRVVRQLMTESVMLALAGGGLGLLFALWGVDLLAALSPADIPRVSEVGLDARVLLFTLGVSLLTGLVFGLVPAWHASKAEVHDALKEGGRGSTEGRGQHRVRSLLVVTEVALALVLLAGAGLLLRSFARLLDVSPGFDAERVLAADVAVGVAGYTDDARRSAFVRDALQRAAAVPGVEAVGAVEPMPLGGSFTAYTFSVEGRPPARPGQEPDTQYRVATPDYFRAMGIPLLAGRAFGERDDARSPRVAVVNETFARRFFPGEEAVGRRLITQDGNSDRGPAEIIGVVGDVRHAGLDAPFDPELYVPYAQSPTNRLSFVARAAADPLAPAAELRAALRRADSKLPVYNVRPVRQLLSESVARRRFNMALLAIFAGVALVLAAVGIYGVMAYTVAQRCHEIGIRVALGAQSSDVFRLVVGQGMGLALAGVGVGLLAALAATRLMSSLLYGVSAADPATFAAISLILAGVAFVACYLPARRATRTDPMTALRSE